MLVFSAIYAIRRQGGPVLILAPDAKRELFRAKNIDPGAEIHQSTKSRLAIKGAEPP